MLIKGGPRIKKHSSKKYPEFIDSSIESKIIHSFQRAAREVPAYKKFLKDKHILAGKIRSISSFKKFVPIIDKDKTFKIYSSRINQLCVEGNLKGVKSILPSSGHSGNFSFGLVTREELNQTTEFINHLFNRYFRIRKVPTLIINCLPMGLTIPTTEGVLVNTSVREDTVLALIRGFSHDFDQIIIIGENSFIKQVLEEGLRQRIDWSKLRIHLILGEEPFPENFRRYLEHLLGKRGGLSLILSSFGISEFGLNLFYETPQTVLIRRLAEERPQLRSALFGEKTKVTPLLFQYEPPRIYVEEIRGELVITNLSPGTKLPLMRYRSGDLGRVITYSHLAEILQRLNLGFYLPTLSLPLVALEARNEFVKINATKIFPEQIKAALYCDWKLASSFTGYFRLTKEKDFLKIEAQLKKDIPLNQRLKENFINYISRNIQVKFKLNIYPYEKFPYGMELNYEKKFKYLP